MDFARIIAVASSLVPNLIGSIGAIGSVAGALTGKPQAPGTQPGIVSEISSVANVAADVATVAGTAGQVATGVATLSGPLITVFLLLLLSPFVVFGVMSLKEQYDLSAAESGQKKQDRIACSAELTDAIGQMNAQSALDAQNAKDAAAALTPTPTTKPELEALCKASASCRKGVAP